MDLSRNPSNPQPDEFEVRSDTGLDQEASVGPMKSKRKTGPTQKRGRDTTPMPINTAATHSVSSHTQDEELSSPLRLALARRSVKEKIFTLMDQGDKKTEIESRTGLSHQCIKWHRQLWRIECSHPRPRSRRKSQSLSRRSQSPSARNERSSKKRPASGEKEDSSGASACSREKRRRKNRTVKQSIGRPVCARSEKLEPGGEKCDEKERKSSAYLTGKENMPGKDEAMVVSVLPIRDLGP